jgi:hypothetical protein
MVAMVVIFCVLEHYKLVLEFQLILTFVVLFQENKTNKKS